MLGHAEDLSKVKWPAYREDLTKEEVHEVIVQINGKVRGKILAEEGWDEEETKQRALNDPRISVMVKGKEVVKVVVVLRKLVSIVVK